MADKITSWPTNWPRDKRSITFEQDGFTCIRHPERAPHKYVPDLKRWVPLGIIQS